MLRWERSHARRAAVIMQRLWTLLDWSASDDTLEFWTDALAVISYTPGNFPHSWFGLYDFSCIMCDCKSSPCELRVYFLLLLTSNSGGFPLGKHFSSLAANVRLWFSPLQSQRAWKADCVLAVPSCSGCLCCFESGDVAAIVVDLQLKLLFFFSMFFFFFCCSWTVSRDLVLSQPAGLTSEWTLLATHIAGIFSCFLKHMLLCKWKLTVPFFSPSKFRLFKSLPFCASSTFFSFLNLRLILQSSDRSLWFLDETFTSVLVNVLGYLIGPVML